MFGQRAHDIALGQDADHAPFGAGLVLGLAAAGLFPLVAGDYGIGVGLSLLSWIALAASWGVLSGMTGYISLGHVVFYGLGGYVMVLCWTQLTPWLAVPLAGTVILSGPRRRGSATGGRGRSCTVDVGGDSATAAPSAR